MSQVWETTPLNGTGFMPLRSLELVLTVLASM